MGMSTIHLSQDLWGKTFCDWSRIMATSFKKRSCYIGTK